MGDISIREHIRWLPDEASEPTSTIVLTSPAKRFVDVRILLPLTTDAKGSLPLDRLDWAMAGTSSSSMRDDEHGGQVQHSVWHHWIDSRTPNAEQVSDEGDMHPRAHGRTLEKGRMANPSTGLATDYEELWRSEEPLPVPGGGGITASCVVLQLHDDGAGARGMVVRLGQHCQGVLRDGDEFTVERWLWTQGNQQMELRGEEAGAARWSRIAKIGNGSMPCEVAMCRASEVKTGEEVVIGEFVWKVVEAVQL